MYPHIYQVVYLEKTIPTLVSWKTSKSVYFFYEVVFRSTELLALENEWLRQASDRQTIEGTKSEQPLTNRHFY